MVLAKVSVFANVDKIFFSFRIVFLKFREKYINDYSFTAKNNEVGFDN